MSVTSPRSKSNLRVLALEPYYALSHQTFLEGYRQHSRHTVEIWKLPPRRWKWRMRGAAFLFAQWAREREAAGAPDVVLASDYLNLPDWKAQAPGSFARAPCVLYFHENQATFPTNPCAADDRQYGWINLSSALAAERVLFNSGFHRDEFLGSAARALRSAGDCEPKGLVEALRERSDVFPVGMDFALHRQIREETPRRRRDVPWIVWNHRWERDKGPEAMVGALEKLRRSGVAFRLAICGRTSKRSPSSLLDATSSLRDVLIHEGFVAEPRDYLGLLRSADVVLSTAHHEFFGVAVIEAMFLGCLPVLPRALSYPEILPESLHSTFLYEPREALGDFLLRFLKRLPYELRPAVERCAERYDWSVLAPSFDAILEETIPSASNGE